MEHYPENPKPILDLIIRCFECKKQFEFHKIMMDLKRELPFEHYGVFRLYIGTGELLNVDLLEWQCDTPTEYKKLLNEERLLDFLPDFLDQMEPDLKDEMVNQLWWTKYRKNLRRMPRKTGEFARIPQYIRKFGGCCCLYQVNPILYFALFCPVLRWEKDEKQPKTSGNFGDCRSGAFSRLRQHQTGQNPAVDRKRV